MSNYQQETQNPLTKKWEMATWMDDYFGHHNYGVRFSDGTIYNPREVELKTRNHETDN